MRVLDRAFFTGQDDPDDSLRECGITNLAGDVTTVLKRLGWGGAAAACVCLSLSTDNTRVEAGVFRVVGQLGTANHNFDASKIWATADSRVMLAMAFDQADVFTFSQGGLASDYIPQESFQYGFWLKDGPRAPTPILEADYAEWGIGNFCLRMTCTIAERSSLEAGLWMSYTILMFPVTKQLLVDSYPLSTKGAWPGMRVVTGEVQFQPRLAGSWGSPVWPLILPGTALDQWPTMPPVAELKRAVSAIMRTGTVPVTGRTGPSVVTRWRRVTTNPSELAADPGPVSWPADTPAAAAVTGRVYDLYI
jgi:hypothetical protein